MEKSPSWETTRSSATPEIIRILWNPKIQYWIHKRPPPVPILSQSNPVHDATFYRAFHNVLHDYKHLQQENQRTYLNGIFRSHRKIEKCFLTSRDVRCVQHGWHGIHRYDIQVLATHASTSHQHIDACVARIWLSYRCMPCHPWCTNRTSLVVKKKNFFSFPVAVKNSIKVGPLVFLL